MTKIPPPVGADLLPDFFANKVRMRYALTRWYSDVGKQDERHSRPSSNLLRILCPQMRSADASAIDLFSLRFYGICLIAELATS